MKYSYSRRLRNAHQHEKKQNESFFAKSNNQEQQPFFKSRVPTGPAVQAKLTIGKANDPSEKEADQVAAKVVAHNADSSIQRASLVSPADDKKLDSTNSRMEKDKLIQEKIQKMASPEEEQEVQAKQDEEEVQVKEEEEEVQAKTQEEELQAKEDEEDIQAKEEEDEIQAKGEAGGPVSTGVSQKIGQAKGRGRPMSGETLNMMQREFSTDFSGVRIHTDAEAAELNKQLRAQAFTRGQDIFFGKGKYRPETHSGQLLLAHELTHVVQQTVRKPITKD